MMNEVRQHEFDRAISVASEMIVDAARDACDTRDPHKVMAIMRLAMRLQNTASNISREIDKV